MHCLSYLGLPSKGGGVATTGRTYVKLPWMPLINVDGSTVYDLDPQAPSRVSVLLACLLDTVCLSCTVVV